MILSTLGGTYTYKNIGLTLMAPDYEIIENMIKVCKKLWNQL